MGDDSWMRGCEFKSWHCKLDGHDIFSHWFVVKIVLFVRKDRKNEKENGVGPFKKTITLTITPILIIPIRMGYSVWYMILKPDTDTDIWCWNYTDLFPDRNWHEGCDERSRPVCAQHSGKIFSAILPIYLLHLSIYLLHLPSYLPIASIYLPSYLPIASIYLPIGSLYFIYLLHLYIAYKYIPTYCIYISTYCIS